MKRKSENKNQIREKVKKGSGPEMPFLILGSKNHYGFSNQKKHLKNSNLKLYTENYRKRMQKETCKKENNSVNLRYPQGVLNSVLVSW